MGNKEFQKSALPTLFYFVRVTEAYQPHVKRDELHMMYILLNKIETKKENPRNPLSKMTLVAKKNR